MSGPTAAVVIAGIAALTALVVTGHGLVALWVGLGVAVLTGVL